MALDKLYRSSNHDGKQTLYILARTIKEAEARLNILDIRAEEKLRLDVSVHAEAARILATTNQDKIIIIHQDLFRIGVWERCFRGKFYDTNDLDKIQTQKDLLDKAEKYDQLKEKIGTVLDQVEGD